MSSGRSKPQRAISKGSGDDPTKQVLEIEEPRLSDDDVQRRKVFDMGGNGGSNGVNLPADQRIIHGLEEGDHVLVKPFDGGVIVTTLEGSNDG